MRLDNGIRIEHKGLGVLVREVPDGNMPTRDIANELDGGNGVVRSAAEFAEGELFGQAYGCGIIGMDERDHVTSREVRITPGDDGADGFDGVAFTVILRRENPADFGHAVQARLDFALKISETEFTQEHPGEFFFHRPVAEAKHGPMSVVAEQTAPDLFAGERASTDEARDDRIGPERRAEIKIVGPMWAQTQPRRFKHRNCARGGLSVGHFQFSVTRK